MNDHNAADYVDMVIERDRALCAADSLLTTSKHMLSRLESETEWISKDYPPRFLVERHEALSSFRASIAEAVAAVT